MYIPIPWYVTLYVYGDHTNPPHPHKSDLSQLQRASSVLCVFTKCLDLVNPNSNLSNRAWWGWGGFVWSQYTPGPPTKSFPTKSP